MKDAEESISYKDAQNIIVKLRNFLLEKESILYTVIMIIETQFNEKLIHKKREMEQKSILNYYRK